MNKPTFIYALHDPRTWAIRYVGKANNPERRRDGHMRRPGGKAFRRFVYELKRLGLELRVSVLCSCSQKDWQNWERFWIRTVQASGAKLFNIAEGGNAPPEERTPEHNAAIGLAQIGRKVSPETRKKIGDANRGRVHSKQARENMGAAKRGKLKSPEHRAKIGAAHVGMKRSDFTKTNISKALRGKKQSSLVVEKKKLITASMWKSQEYREKVSSGLRESWRKRKEN